MDRKNIITSFLDWLSEPISGKMLGLFRMLYGMVMTLEMFYYWRIDLVKNMFVLPVVNFKYDGFEWIQRLPEKGMYTLLAGLTILAILMALGVWFRWVARFFAIGYAYLFLIDKSIYNNHIYLYIMLAAMLSFLECDQYYSIGKRRQEWVPRWQQFIFQFQMVVVYFFAGVVKFKPQWLYEQEPVRSLVKGINPNALLAGFVKSELGIYLLNYGGLALDILAPILLWYKPIRKWAILPFALFHMTNMQMINDIAFFPVLMLAGLLIFYEPTELPWLFTKNQVQGDQRKTQKKMESFISPLKTGLPVGWMAFMAFQVLFPFRGFFLPNDMDWTTIGNRFAWRVKADSRGEEVLRYSVLYTNGQRAEVDIHTFVNTHQRRLLLMDPRAVRELGIAVKKEVEKQGGDVAAVNAYISFTNMGKNNLLFVDPNADLTKVKYSPFEILDWVIPPK